MRLGHITELYSNGGRTSRQDNKVTCVCVCVCVCVGGMGGVGMCGSGVHAVPDSQGQETKVQGLVRIV